MPPSAKRVGAPKEPDPRAFSGSRDLVPIAYRGRELANVDDVRKTAGVNWLGAGAAFSIVIASAVMSTGRWEGRHPR